MKKNDGGPAFPQTNDSWVGTDGNTAVPEGMSLRDWFAGHAVSPMLIQAYGNTPAILAGKAYQLADAMLQEREKEE